MTKPYILYIDGMEIPVTPAKVKNKRPGQNETYNLINGDTFTVLRKAKLEEFSFSFYAFSHEHPGVDTFTPQEAIISKLEELKKEKKNFEFVILRTPSDPSLRNSYCKHMTLEDWDIDEDNKYGTNAIISLELMEYQPLKTIKLDDVGSNTDKRQVKQTVIKEVKRQAPSILVSCVQMANPMTFKTGLVKGISTAKNIWDKVMK